MCSIGVAYGYTQAGAMRAVNTYGLYLFAYCVQYGKTLYPQASL